MGRAEGKDETLCKRSDKSLEKERIINSFRRPWKITKGKDLKRFLAFGSMKNTNSLNKKQFGYNNGVRNQIALS